MFKQIMLSSLFLTSISTILPFISYRLMLHPEGKVVLIYGDAHGRLYDKASERHLTELFQTIDTECVNQQPINCIYEFPQDGKGNYGFTSNYIFYRKNEFAGKINFIESDPRDPKICSYVMQSMNACMCPLLHKNTSLNDSAAPHFFRVPRIHGLPYKFLDLATYLVHSQTIMESWLSCYLVDSPEYTMLQSAIASYKNGLDGFTELFEGVSIENILLDELFSKFASMTIYEARNFLQYLKKLVDQTFTAYSEISYLHQLLLMQKLNCKMMLSVGEYHAAHLEKTLVSAGYQTIACEVIIQFKGRWDNKLVTLTDNFDSNINKAFTLFNQLSASNTFENACELAKKILDPVVISEILFDNRCDICLKTTPEIISCETCNDAYYCSLDCQYFDLLEHQKICHRINSKGREKS